MLDKVEHPGLFAEGPEARNHVEVRWASHGSRTETTSTFTRHRAIVHSFRQTAQKPSFIPIVWVMSFFSPPRARTSQLFPYFTLCLRLKATWVLTGIVASTL